MRDGGWKIMTEVREVVDLLLILSKGFPMDGHSPIISFFAFTFCLFVFVWGAPVLSASPSPVDPSLLYVPPRQR